MTGTAFKAPGALNRLSIVQAIGVTRLGWEKQHDRALGANKDGGHDAHLAGASAILDAAAAVMDAVPDANH